MSEESSPDEDDDFWAVPPLRQTRDSKLEPREDQRVPVRNWKRAAIAVTLALVAAGVLWH